MISASNQPVSEADLIFAADLGAHISALLRSTATAIFITASNS